MLIDHYASSLSEIWGFKCFCENILNNPIQYVQGLFHTVHQLSLDENRILAYVA